MEYNNLVISDSEKSYKILQPIGTWGPDFSLIVYEAIILEDIDITNNEIDDDAPHVAFKMIKDTDDLQDSHEMVVDDVNRSIAFVADGSRYILPIFKSFYSEIYGNQTLCIVLPYDSHAVSLRSLMSANPRFASGIHDKFIAIVLIRVFKALNKIHKKGNHHMKITAGNIFYNYQSDTIQLAYAASAYERDITLNYGNVCSVNKMLAWGVAPEVKKDDESLEFVDTYDTKKSDIWLVGIAALELAYGQIPVESRRELLEIASYISAVKILPNTWEELRHKSAELAADRALPFKKRRFKEGQANIIALATEMEERRLSDNFGSLVATCLDADGDKRASAKQLRKHVFLKENIGSVAYFRDVIVNGINPHVARFLGGSSKKDSKIRKQCRSKSMLSPVRLP